MSTLANNQATNADEQSTSSNLTNFEINKLEGSRYINPYRVTFNQNNCKRIWDGVS